MKVTVIPVVDEAPDLKEPNKIIRRTGCPGNNKYPLDDSTTAVIPRIFTF